MKLRGRDGAEGDTAPSAAPPQKVAEWLHTESLPDGDAITAALIANDYEDIVDLVEADDDEHADSDDSNARLELPRPLLIWLRQNLRSRSEDS